MALLVLASLLAPGVAVAAEAVHVALHHETGATSASVAGGLNRLRHGHAHDADTAEHEHPLLVAGMAGVRTAAPPANPFGTAAWRSLERAVELRASLRVVTVEHGGVGPPPPPRSVSILRI